ncbi:hypothetical protein SAMN05421827_10258 [Pedobacter terrae]|uniref:Uncharacterized protein n=1 Tax=Pedobacter terrae TaxID=405671 RepID=A0A1G7PVH5_9SPHI|nr:hypothetical protein SAMN05421827_10258 [Pedobacter terrae]
MLGKSFKFDLELMPVRRLLIIDCIKARHGLQRFSFHDVLSLNTKKNKHKN